MIDVLNTIKLWITTAFRAAPALTALMWTTTILSSVLNPLQLYGVKFAVDAISQGTSVLPGVVLLGLCMVLTGIANSFAGPIGDTLDEKVYWHVHDDLLRLTAQIPSIDHHEDRRLADRISQIERNRNQLAGVFRLFSIVGGVTSTITVVAMLWSVSPFLLLLLVLGVLVAGVQVWGLHQRRMVYQKDEHLRRLGNTITDTLTESPAGVEIRCFGLGPALLNVAAQILYARDLPFIQITNRFGRRVAVTWVVYGIGYAAAVLWIFQQARTGSATLGDLSLVVLIGPQVNMTATAIAFNVRIVFDSMDAFGRYRWLRDYFDRHQWEHSTAVPPDRLQDGIRFDQVSFAYPSSQAGHYVARKAAVALHGVDLVLPAGSMVALVGDNGAGKSTMIKLLARLYDPTDGAVLIDGVPLADIDPQAWRDRIAAGFQDFARLEFLAADSVGVGDLEASGDRELINKAVAVGQATPVIGALPAGLDTQLGRQFDGGVGLSGGQWQRLALARAFMRRRPLLMLLDEPTAALDPEAEQALFEQYSATARRLAAETGSVTVLVSHRFSTVRLADLIVVVADGGIAEHGTHAELMAAGGRYAELFRLQAHAYR